MIKLCLYATAVYQRKPEKPHKIKEFERIKLATTPFTTPF